MEQPYKNKLGYSHTGTMYCIKTSFTLKSENDILKWCKEKRQLKQYHPVKMIHGGLKLEKDKEMFELLEQESKA